MAVKDYTPWVPFDLYDFFGYLFPGIYFTFSGLAYLGHHYPSLLRAHQDFWPLYSNAEFLVGLFAVGTLIVMLYVIGHFVATMSHIVIDRALVGGIIGYPITHLLELKRNKRDYSEATVKYAFVLLNAMLIAALFIPTTDSLRSICFPTTILLTLLIVFRFSMTFLRMKPNGPEIARKYGDMKLFRWYLWIAEELIDPIIIFFRKVISADKPFHKTLIEHFKSKFKTRFGLESNNLDSDNYWLAYFAATDFNTTNSAMFKTWLHLYGFARNMAAASYLIAFLILVHLLWSSEPISLASRVQLLVTLTLAYAFAIRYWILFSSYYTKNIIRAFVALPEEPMSTNDSSRRTRLTGR